MLEKIIKDYFSFTRKERLAVMVLVCLTIIIYLLPYFIPEQVEFTDKKAFDTLRLSIDRPAIRMEDPGKTGRTPAYLSGSLNGTDLPQKAGLFYFDPNSLSIEGWKKLGLRDKTIQTIRNYISKGGRFKNREDISRIYGLHPDEAERLKPFVKIATTEKKLPGEFHQQAIPYRNEPPVKKPASTPIVIDINTADTAAWIALPGIGSKLASRIVNFREKLGGFYSIDQLSEIYGLPDSTFQKLRPALQNNTPVVPHLNINTAQSNDLKQHPYIKWNIANAMVEFRRQHSNFKSLEDLRKIDIVTEEIYRKMVPYLKVE